MSKRRRHKKHLRLTDFLEGAALTIGVLLLGTLIAVEVYTNDPFTLFNRGGGMLSDLLYVANIIFLLGLTGFTCFFAVKWCYERGREFSFFGMEAVLVLVVISYLVCWIYSAAFSWESGFLHNLYKVFMVLQIPFSSICRGAVNGIVQFTGKSELEEAGLRAISEVIFVLAAVAPAALLFVREIDHIIEMFRKHKIKLGKGGFKRER